MEEKGQNREKSLKILGIQMSSVIGDKWENFSKIAELIEKNIKKGTDVIVLPEVWTVGWYPGVFEESSEDFENSETIEFLSEIAQKYNANVIGGSFISKAKSKKQKTKGGNCSPLTAHRSLFNTCPVFNRQGELITTYDKMHLFSYYGCDEGKHIESGKNPVLLDIDGIKIGLSLCYDIRFPELYRAYRKAGADILINMAAWPKSRAIHWESLSKARAIENQCFMVALTQSGKITKDEYNLGHSMIIDYNGEVLSEIKDDKNGGEGAIFAEIKFNEMYKFREKCTVLLDIHDKYEVK